MDTVSQLQKIIIRLDKQQVPCEIICEKVQYLINKSSQSGMNLMNSFLTIEIKTINGEDDSYIPKLEHKILES